MQQIILMVHVLVSLALIGLVLIQHGKGADMGAALGAGASQTVFGSQGSTSFLMKITAILAAVFFATSLTLGYMATQDYKNAKQVVIQAPSSVTQPAQHPAPTTPAKQN